MIKPDLGTKSLMVAGEHYTKRLRQQTLYECQHLGIPMPTDAQLGAVLKAMGDHTAVMAMTRYDKSNLHKPDEIDPYWPIETSVGRFLRDTGYAFVDLSNGLEVTK